METTPFDPARYLETDEAIAAFLADARIEGGEVLADAEQVVARARALNARSALRGVGEPPTSLFKDHE